MAETKEWYTLDDIVKLTGIPYAKVRFAVFTKRNEGAINVRSNPIDSRVLEVHANSLDAVKKALGL